MEENPPAPSLMRGVSVRCLTATSVEVYRELTVNTDMSLQHQQPSEALAA